MKTKTITKVLMQYEKGLQVMENEISKEGNDKKVTHYKLNKRKRGKE